MPENLKPQDVLQWFGEREPTTAEGAMILAGALIATRQEKRAEHVIQVAWAERSFSRENEQDFIKRFGKFLGNKQHWARLDRLLWEGQEDGALRQLPRVDKDHQALARARMKLADQAKDAAAWTRIYAQLPEEEYPTARAHVEELTSISRKAVYDDVIEAIIAAAERDLPERGG